MLRFGMPSSADGNLNQLRKLSRPRLDPRNGYLGIRTRPGATFPPLRSDGIVDPGQGSLVQWVLEFRTLFLKEGKNEVQPFTGNKPVERNRGAYSLCRCYQRHPDAVGSGPIQCLCGTQLQRRNDEEPRKHQPGQCRRHYHPYGKGQRRGARPDQRGCDRVGQCFPGVELQQ